LFSGRRKGMSAKTALKLVLAILLVAGILACEGVVREPATKTQKVELGEADSVEVDLRMGAGELKLAGGATALMEGTFRYNVERWTPEVDYQVFNKKGRLLIQQRKRHGLHFGRTKNTWDIRLNNTVPMDMTVNLGAGSSDLNLQNFSIKRLEIDMGVGELTLDLSGERKKDLEVKIDGGVGSGTIYLPENIGVRAEIEGGIGSVHAPGFHKDGHVYTNDAYGKGGVSINLRIEAGIGSIELRVR
jgi:hypothetical protein